MPLVSADVRWEGMRDEPKERLRRRLFMHMIGATCWSLTFSNLVVPKGAVGWKKAYF